MPTTGITARDHLDEVIARALRAWDAEGRISAYAELLVGLATHPRTQNLLRGFDTLSFVERFLVGYASREDFEVFLRGFEV